MGLHLPPYLSTPKVILHIVLAWLGEREGTLVLRGVSSASFQSVETLNGGNKEVERL